MNKVYCAVSIAVFTLGLSSVAQAGGRHHHNHDHHYHKEHRRPYAWARVLDVQEVYEKRREKVPVEHCTERRSSSRGRHARYDSHRDSHRDSATPAILGGIIGGALGNELGHHKSAQKVGAVVGAALGASIGHDIGKAHHRHKPRDRDTHVTRCHTRYEERWSKELVGYDVEYRYKGHIYTTFRENPPRRRIKIARASHKKHRRRHDYDRWWY